jgi:hypothetical protein
MVGPSRGRWGLEGGDEVFKKDECFSHGGSFLFSGVFQSRML